MQTVECLHFTKSNTNQEYVIFVNELHPYEVTDYQEPGYELTESFKTEVSAIFPINSILRRE